MIQVFLAFAMEVVRGAWAFSTYLAPLFAAGASAASYMRTEELEEAFDEFMHLSKGYVLGLAGIGVLTVLLGFDVVQAGFPLQLFSLLVLAVLFWEF